MGSRKRSIVGKMTTTNSRFRFFFFFIFFSSSPVRSTSFGCTARERFGRRSDFSSLSVHGYCTDGTASCSHVSIFLSPSTCLRRALRIISHTGLRRVSVQRICSSSSARWEREQTNGDAAHRNDGYCFDIWHIFICLRSVSPPGGFISHWRESAAAARRRGVVSASDMERTRPDRWWESASASASRERKHQTLLSLSRSRGSCGSRMRPF